MWSHEIPSESSLLRHIVQLHSFLMFNFIVRYLLVCLLAPGRIMTPHEVLYNSDHLILGVNQIMSFLMLFVNEFLNVILKVDLYKTCESS